MAIDLNSYDFSYKMALITLRLSGFVFFSSDPTLEDKFRQNWYDFFIFLLSVSFSLRQLLGEQDNTRIKWKSAVLSFGIVLLLRIKQFSVLLSKLVNLSAAKTSFMVIRQSKAIDRKVSSSTQLIMIN